MAFDFRLRVSFLRLNLPEVVRYFPFCLYSDDNWFYDEYQKSQYGHSNSHALIDTNAKVIDYRD
jgi:hypothetical protein